MRVFVTGITGFAGAHLSRHLQAQGHTIYGLVRNSRPSESADSAVHLIVGDLLDPASVQAAVSEAQPDVIFHLAGQAYPARSWRVPAATLAVNAGGTANLLEAAITVGRPRVLVVTTADMYGAMQPDDLPITESTPTHPRHPYGISKLAASELVRVYWERYQLPVVEARPFNHIGPGQALGFVVPDFAAQIAAIHLGLQPATISVGNLSAARDFTDVRDVVRAYAALAMGGAPGQHYLICSGQPVAIRSIFNTLCELAERDIAVAYDPDRMRPSDEPVLFGSHARIRKALNWEPTIHLRETLRDVLDEWIARLRAEPTLAAAGKKS
jgi:GDP-4-dehydro-6-deoxy-D-mannose reductase